MQLHRAGTLSDFVSYLEENVEEVQALFNDLLITVTMFFRDAAAWDALRDNVVRPLLAEGEPSETIRCWVPGCATGEEAYTLAILFSEEIRRSRLKREFILFASDVDEESLARAREGIYPSTICADLPDEHIKNWFRERDNHYQIVSAIRERVIFTVHSLQRDPPVSRLHLMSCRNLLIYLDRELQEQVMGIFRYACREDGYLFLGQSETADAELFDSLVREHRIYKARESASGRRAMLANLPIGGSKGLLPLKHRDRTNRERERASESHRVMLERLAPPSLIDDSRWSIVHLS
jgi:two-component system CheB/CheR fusion protein